MSQPTTSKQLHAFIACFALAFLTNISAFAPIAPRTFNVVQYQSSTITTTTTSHVQIQHRPKSKSSELYFFNKMFGRKDDDEKATPPVPAVLETEQSTAAVVETEEKLVEEEVVDDEELTPVVVVQAEVKVVEAEVKVVEAEEMVVEAEEKVVDAKVVEESEKTDESTEEEKKDTPFFARMANRIKSKAEPEPTPAKPLTALEEAKALRAKAERTRLEAEKMDIMLTLEKINKLEIKLSTKAVAGDKTLEEDIQRQLKMLKRRLDGDSSPMVVEEGSSKSASASASGTAVPKKDLDAVLNSVVSATKAKVAGETLTSEDMGSRIEQFNRAPKFMQELVVKAAGMEMQDLNTTALMLKMYNDEKDFQLKNGFDAGEAKAPQFTKEQLEDVLDAVKMVPQFVKNMYDDETKNNDTAIAMLLLEEEWKSGKLVVIPEITQKMIDAKLEEIQWVPQFLRGDNETELAIQLIKSDFRRNPGTGKPVGVSEVKNSPAAADASASTSTTNAVEEVGKKGGLFGVFDNQDQRSDRDQMVESLFPESTRKVGEEIKESQAVLFMSEVLSKDKTWAVTGPPEKVSGGFLIRGSTKFKTGAELIEAIDKNLATSRVKNQVNVFYVFDPTPVTETQMDEGERPPVLFLTAQNVVRDPAPIQRSFITAVAFGTIWYTSLLPFLLNDKYMKMADEQLALADAAMSSNVDFLTDLSLPLFAATVGIQVVHEVAHLIVASNNGMNTTIPTLVPSIGTGLMGAITSLQTPPKNKQALFDFAIAGPLAGMAASAALLVVGMSATSSMDAAAFADLPALPLNLLRQSSLVGGIIDSFSPGLLTVPDGALGTTAAISEINIALHPLAIAGYFGMMINAVNLLPVGRTDGGRISLTLFGRSGTQLVSLAAFIFIFIQGLTGSDVLLFFFSFVIFFQSELEIPQRNEVDDMDFSRVLLATATGVLVLLTLIPM